MPVHPDSRIHDLVALAEIELYADVLSAVAMADAPLSDAELDEALGITPAQPRREGLRRPARRRYVPDKRSSAL